MTDSIATGAGDSSEKPHGSHSDFVFGDHLKPCHCLRCQHHVLEIVLCEGLMTRNKRLEQRVLRENPSMTGPELETVLHRHIAGELKAFRWN